MMSCYGYYFIRLLAGWNDCDALLGSGAFSLGGAFELSVTGCGVLAGCVTVF